ncbi:DEAD/DEAH box RNA helicase family protein [Toxoplasma gondii VEG]|uniref:DEAD/DEAH box RNA helicase family protein n=5 Tax=Toxoplasma gondii TaxID=5811 RepID=B9QLU2_TOXGV|nr:DEAD/DEAH box RNA helicase family protein [Toxoplasma gondii VEG]CEL78117.1 TPA: DEAD/DEAH box RNA helicase, putative [Toxoplasma gondii VEG]
MGSRGTLSYQSGAGGRDKRKREERLELSRKKKAKKRQEEYAAARRHDSQNRHGKPGSAPSSKRSGKTNRGRLCDTEDSSEENADSDEEVEEEEEEEEVEEEEEEEEEGENDEEDEDVEGEEEVDEDEDVELSDGCLDVSFGEEDSDEDAADSDADDGEAGSTHQGDREPLSATQTKKQGGDEDLEVDSGNQMEKDQKTKGTPGHKKQCAYVKHNALLHTQTAWGDLPLSRPLLRAIQDLEYAHPTHIQAACLRPALEGRDLLANAQTGSGKTAAFLLPTLERLLHSPGVRSRKMTANGPTGGLRGTKALVLLPTRELAMQCVQMLQCLSKYTPITHALACGGMTLKAHESALRHQPDIVVATPGRILDLLLNSPTVHLELLEIIVLDEADRLLELGFREEILAILRHCHRARQTLLFSATLTPSIASLASLALNRPLHISAEATVTDSTAGREKSGFTVTSLQAATAALKTVSSTLEQQFVMLHREEHRAPALLHLCTTAYTKNVIVFFQTKKLAHQTSLLFKFMGLKYAELHGNLTQQMRVEALERFHAGEADFLLASELASRGLDIAGVEAVINFNVPADIDRYIHSVGRTARMGRSGVAVTIYHRDGTERLQVKKLLHALRSGLNQPGEKAVKGKKGKGDKAQDGSLASGPRVFQRRIDADKLEMLEKKVKSLQGDIVRELKREKLEREVRLAELHLQKAENLQTHADEIYSRPMRQWFMTAKEKQRLKDESKALVGKDAEERDALERARASSSDERNGRAPLSEDEAEEDSETEADNADQMDSDDEEDVVDESNSDDGELPEWITACSDDSQSVEDEIEEPPPKKKAKAVTVKEFKATKPKAQPIGGNKEKKKQERLTPKQRERMKELQFMKAAARSAKRSQMPKRLRVTHTSPNDVHNNSRRPKNQKKRKLKASGWRAEEPKKPQGGKNENKKQRNVKTMGKKAFKSKGRYKRR